MNTPHNNAPRTRTKTLTSAHRFHLLSNSLFSQIKLRENRASAKLVELFANGFFVVDEMR